MIQSASAARCDASGSLQDDGAYVLVTHSLTYSSLGGKNSLSRSYRFRRVRETSWQNANIWKRSPGDIVGAGDISPDYSYEIELKAEDELENVSRILPVSTAKVIMDWKKGGARHGYRKGLRKRRPGSGVACNLSPEPQITRKQTVLTEWMSSRANDEGETYRTGFATGKSGNSLCGYVGFYTPDNQAINALYLWEDRTSLGMPLAVGSGGTRGQAIRSTPVPTWD